MPIVRSSGGGSGGSASYTDERVRDVVGSTLVAGSNVTITPDDTLDTITVAAATSGASGIPASTVNAKGDLIAGTADDTVAVRSVGTNGQALLADSAQTTGLAWGAPVPADASVTDVKVASGAAISADKLADGTTNKVYTATEKTKLAGIASGATAGIVATIVDAKGDLIAATAADTVARLAVGTDGLALVAASGQTTGLQWAAPAPASHTHAASDVTSGTVATARLGSGSASSTTFLRGDQTWATPAGGSGTVTVQLDPAGGTLRSSGFPALVQANGTTIPVRGLAFDASTLEAVFFRFRATSYGSGSLTVSLDWYADTASTNAVVWGAAIAAITPNTDSQDAETDALATASTTTTTHLGTTGQRLHRTSITVSNLDSIAADDHVALQVYRDAANGSDTLAGDAILVAAAVSWSTT